MTKKIGHYTESHLLKRSAEIVAKKGSENTIFDEDADKRIPKFKTSELTIGRVLGRGGFCVVSEITKVTLRDSSRQASTKSGKQKRRSSNNLEDLEEEEYQITNIVQDRKFMEQHCIRGGKDARYAIKKLSDDCMKDPSLFVNGIVDLAIEARFLAVIRHPNIIKMRAVEIGPPSSKEFFVVLDRLYDIMSQRVKTWKKRQPSRFLDRKGKKREALWLERVTVGHDLACALKYMHSLNVIYRDLKPDNIGFDVRGDVKIFDFGLAKQLNPDKRDKNDCYKLTGDTGSPRYMAPEVALFNPYNLTVDCYSFGILFYQILAMETPFEHYNMSMFKKSVILGGVRPKPNPKWPEGISTLLRKCWHVKISERPSMEDIVSEIRREITRHTDDEVHELLDASRKSEMSMHHLG